MKIVKVISYKNAWENLRRDNLAELIDISEVIPAYFTEFRNSVESKANRFTASRDIWNSMLSSKGWVVLDRVIIKDRHRISISQIGPVKNSISAFFSIGHMDLLNRWLFQQTTLASKFEIAKIPILLVPTNDLAKSFERFYLYSTFESHLRQLEPLTPLSHANPFLILGVGENDSEEIELYELEADAFVGDGDIVIDRCIEFPPEFHQAGLGILSYFSTYLNEQYPDEKAKVKIEQNGQIVRLIIETSSGEKKIIEKALFDYQLVVTGNKKIEDITQNQKLILELNSELRIAKYRIETQQDLIQLQSGQIEKLFNIIGNGLSAKSQIYLDFKPKISLNNTTFINNNISEVLSSINDIKSLIPIADPNYIVIEDLLGSLEAVQSESDPATLKKSPSLPKLKKFIENLANGKDQLSKTIKAADNGLDMIKSLAGKYNSIAEWCGLPQVPKIFTK